MTMHKAVQMLQMQQEAVQKRTFSRWMDAHLSKWRPPLKINDLFEDIKDGTKLLILLQILSGERLHGETGKNLKRVHFLTNVRVCLEFLESKKIKLVNINPSDIVDGKPSIVLGLLWTCILYFQIEELTSNLTLTSELSASTSSLDSTNDDGTPSGKKKKRGARAKWQGAATKALLQWVKKRTNNEKKSELPVQVNDFGVSWKDGKAFNSMIHSINPNLIDLDEVMRATNRENLERAFATAEKHLGIPRLLEPEDLDVDKPDEKSIMTYVAQFVRHVNKQGQKDGDEEVPEVDDDTIYYEDLMSWLAERDAQLSDVHRTKKYRQQDYVDNQKLRSELPPKLQLVRELRAKVDAGQVTSISADQLEAIETLASKVDQANKRWHVELDSRLPGQLGQVGAWLHRAEDVINRSDTSDSDVTDDDEAADLIRGKIEAHQEVFKDMQQMSQAFNKGKRTYKFSGQSIPPEQLEELTKRLQDVKVTSERRQAELELRESKRRLQSELKRAEAKLAKWNEKPTNQNAIQQLLNHYKEHAEDGKMVERIEEAAARLRKSAENYFQSDEKIAVEERVTLREFISDKEEQVKSICDDVTAVKTTLEEIAEKWEDYEESLGKITPWIEQAAQLVQSNQPLDKEFFTKLPEYQETFSKLQRAAAFLVDNCDVSVADDVSNTMSQIGDRAQHVFEKCEELASAHQVAQRREHFLSEVGKLDEIAVSVENSLVREIPVGKTQLENRIDMLQKILRETDNIGDDVTRLTALADDVTDEELRHVDAVMGRVTRARDDVTREIGKLAEMLKPVECIEDEIDDVTRWLERADALMTSHERDGIDTGDVEKKYQEHEDFFSAFEDKQDMIRQIAQKMNDLQDNNKGAKLDDMEHVISMTSSRLQDCMERAGKFRPKLRKGALAIRNYRTSLATMETWLASSKQALGDESQLPLRERLDVHEEILLSVDDSPLSKLLHASEEMKEVLANKQDENDKVYEETSHIQEEYTKLLKTANHQFCHLRFEEVEKEFQELITRCRTYLDEEENQPQDVPSELRIQQHDEFMSEPLLRLVHVLDNMDSLAERLDVPDERLLKKIQRHRDTYENLLIHAERMRSKLQQLPEKLAKFEAGLGEIGNWVRKTQQTMEQIHEPMQPDYNYFLKLKEDFNKIKQNKGEVNQEVEILDRILQEIVNYMPSEEYNKHKEKLKLCEATVKSLLNTIEVSGKRLDQSEKCFSYRTNIQVTRELIEDEVRNLEELAEKAKKDRMDSHIDANNIYEAAQVVVNQLDALTSRVNDDVTRGKDLHADEQTPTFLYDDVAQLEQLWESARKDCAAKYEYYQLVASSWQQYESVRDVIVRYLEQWRPLTELRLSTLSSVEREIAAANQRLGELDTCDEMLDKLRDLRHVIAVDASDRSRDDVSAEMAEFGGRLEAIRAETGEAKRKIETVKRDWLACDDVMMTIDEWIQLVYSQIPEMEESDESAESLFQKVREKVGLIAEKEGEITEIETRCAAIEGLESPSTLHANLANLRAKWQQLHNRMEALATSIGEHLSHQEKFDGVRHHVEECLKDAEKHFQLPVAPCSSSLDVAERKNDHVKFTHSIEQIRPGISSLQSEAKLLKDPKSADSIRQQLQERYNDVINGVRSRKKTLEEATTRWQKYDKDFNSVRAFIERCDEIASDNLEPGGLPGDQNKLKNELETLTKLSASLPNYLDTIDGLSSKIEDLERVIPINSDVIMEEIETMRERIDEIPRQLAERERIVTSALESHEQYAETVEKFTTWLLQFERVLRNNTDVYLDDVRPAAELVEVSPAPPAGGRFVSLEERVLMRFFF